MSSLGSSAWIELLGGLVQAQQRSVPGNGCLVTTLLTHSLPAPSSFLNTPHTDSIFSRSGFLNPFRWALLLRILLGVVLSDLLSLFIRNLSLELRIGWQLCSSRAALHDTSSFSGEGSSSFGFFNRMRKGTGSLSLEDHAADHQGASLSSFALVQSSRHLCPMDSPAPPPASRADPFKAPAWNFSNTSADSSLALSSKRQELTGLAA